MTKRKLATLCMTVGVVLMLAAGSLLMYNRWDENRASDAAMYTADLLATFILEQTGGTNDDDDVDDSYYSDDDPLPEEPGYELQPTVVYDGKLYLGVLSIPALDLSLPVMEFWNYDKLKISPCRYSGNLSNDNMVVMAHNYDKHFGSISTLLYGEYVTFMDAHGNEYVYEVAEIETVNSNDIDGMVNNEYDFTMFTCNYSGQARIAVRCYRV